MRKHEGLSRSQNVGLGNFFGIFSRKRRYHNSQIYNAFDAIGIITYDHHGHHHDDKDFHLDVLDVIGVITQNRR